MAPYLSDLDLVSFDFGVQLESPGKPGVAVAGFAHDPCAIYQRSL